MLVGGGAPGSRYAPRERRGRRYRRDVPTRSRGRVLTPGLVLVILAAAVAIYLVASRAKPFLTGSGCQAGTGKAAIALDPDQAAIAATIAGVAHRRAMPARAVEVAYAAALQESHLHNLTYGDRDSVGVFQQRPSEGWGPASKLKNPVYASAKFFGALATVHGYLHTPVYKAAQAVQHSADGFAYIQYQPEATALAADFTGGSAHAAVTPGDAPTMVVHPRRPALGWAVASWLVTHASSYGIHDVRYAGYRWQESSGSSGWTRDKSQTGPDVVRAS